MAKTKNKKQQTKISGFEKAYLKRQNRSLNRVEELFIKTEQRSIDRYQPFSKYLDLCYKKGTTIGDQYINRERRRVFFYHETDKKTLFSYEISYEPMYKCYSHSTNQFKMESLSLRDRNLLVLSEDFDGLLEMGTELRRLYNQRCERVSSYIKKVFLDMILELLHKKYESYYRIPSSNMIKINGRVHIFNHIDNGKYNVELKYGGIYSDKLIIDYDE